MNWKLTQNAIGEPVVDTLHDDPDEDLTLGYALIRALAEADQPAQELADGVHYWPKSEHDQGKWI